MGQISSRNYFQVVRTIGLDSGAKKRRKKCLKIPRPRYVGTNRLLHPETVEEFHQETVQATV